MASRGVVPPRRRRVALALLAAVWLAGAAWLGAAVARAWPATGLRFAQPLADAQVQAALEYAQGGRNAEGVTFSFWRQDTAPVTDPATRRTVGQVAAIGFLGDAADCLGVRWLAGAPPGSGDGYGCAVSTELAWQLFGSTQAVGLELAMGGKTYGVTGVFHAPEPVLLYGATGGFTAAELRGVPGGDPAGAVARIAAAAGLGSPALVLYGPQRAWVARVLLWLPLALAGAALLAAALRCTLAWPRPLRGAAWLGLAVAAALLLPAALAALPGWLLPDRWGNFGFWGQLFAQAAGQRRAWQAAARCIKDLCWAW